MYRALCVSVAFFVLAVQLPTNYVNHGAVSCRGTKTPRPNAAAHTERRTTVQANREPANEDWNGDFAKTSPNPSTAISGLMMVALAVCAGVYMSAQPADARPFNAGKLYGADKRDEKGLLHAIGVKMTQQEKRPAIAQFLKDDSKRVELAAKRNGMLFSTLNMDADRAEKVKAALMSGGLLAGLVIANPGNAFPRPGSLK